MDSKARLIKEYQAWLDENFKARWMLEHSIECPECGDTFLPSEDYLCKDCRAYSSVSESNLSRL